jgi:hypothetical protein
MNALRPGLSPPDGGAGPAPMLVSPSKPADCRAARSCPRRIETDPQGHRSTWPPTVRLVTHQRTRPAQCCCNSNDVFQQCFQGPFRARRGIVRVCGRDSTDETVGVSNVFGRAAMGSICDSSLSAGLAAPGLYARCYLRESPGTTPVELSMVAQALALALAEAEARSNEIVHLALGTRRRALSVRRRCRVPGIDPSGGAATSGCDSDRRRSIPLRPQKLRPPKRTTVR